MPAGALTDLDLPTMGSAPLRIHDIPPEPLAFSLRVRVPEGARPGDWLTVPVRAWHDGEWDRLRPEDRPADAYRVPGFGWASYGSR